MFLISKLVGLLLNPLLWIVAVMIYSWFTKYAGRRRKSAGLALLLIIFFTNNWIIQNLTLAYQYKPMPMKPGEHYSAGILLGGLAGYDERERQAFFSSASDRFIQAMLLYKEGHIRKIIVSGGNGNAAFGGYDFREADFLVEKLIHAGIPKDDIITERNSKNTIENGRFTKRITDSLKMPEPFVLISSAFHMPRAVRIFSHEGMKVRPYPCAFQVLASDKKFSWVSLIPSVNAPGLWSIYLKEQVGNLFLTLQKK